MQSIAPIMVSSVLKFRFEKSSRRGCEMGHWDNILFGPCLRRKQTLLPNAISSLLSLDHRDSLLYKLCKLLSVRHWRVTKCCVPLKGGMELCTVVSCCIQL